MAAPPAFAQTLQDDFETGTVLKTDAPAGKWDARFLGGTNTLDAVAAGLHRGATGVRMVDSSTTASNVALRMDFPAGITGNLYTRYWVRLSSLVSTGTVLLSTLQIDNLGTPNEHLTVRINATGATGNLITVFGTSNGPTTTDNTSAGMDLGTWYLVEIASLGLNTTSGHREVYLNGTSIAARDLDYSVATYYRFNLGQLTAGASRITVDYDDVRTGTTPPASHFQLSGPATAQLRGCTALQVTLRESEANALAGAPYALSSNLQLSGVSGGFFSDAGCTAATTTVSFAAAANTATVYFSPTTVGAATLSAAHVDFLPASLNVTVSDTLAPSVPSGVTATPPVGRGNVTVTWGASTDSGTGVTNYDVEVSSNGGGTWAPLVTQAATTYSYAPAQGSYLYRVRARDGAANVSAFSTASSSVLVDKTAPTVPGVPTVTQNANGSITVGWGASSDTGGSGLAVYHLEVSSDGGTVWAPLVNPATASHTYVPAPGSYRYRVSAEDGAGNVSAPSTPSAPFSYLGATQLAFVNPARSIVAGGCSGALTVELQFGNGAPGSRGAAVDVVLSSSQSGSGSFHLDSSCMGPAVTANTLTVPAGSSRAPDVYYRDVMAPLAVLSASAPTFTSANQSVSIAPGPASRFELSGIPTPILIGASSGLQVRATDAFGNAVAGYSGQVGFSSSDPLAELPPPASMSGQMALPGGVRFFSVGSHTVTARDLSNPALSGVHPNVLVTDNGAPAIRRDANLRAGLGRPYRYNQVGALLVTGKAPLTYGVCGGPPEFQVDTNTGAVRWSPTTLGAVPLCVWAKNDLAQDTYNFTVTVVDPAAAAPVVAQLTAAPQTGAAPLTVQLDASGSTADPAALPLVFEWDYGDSSGLGSGATASHVYLTPGGYWARVAAYDAFGSRSEAKASIRVTDAMGRSPPLARIVASATQGPAPLAVDLSCDCQQGTAPIVRYEWDWGAAQSTSSRPALQLNPGRYHVRLRVLDAAGLEASDELELVATQNGALPPSCRAVTLPSAGVAPLTVAWHAFAAAAQGRIVSRLWDFGAAGVASGSPVLATYSSAGRVEGHLVVEDDSGLRCFDQATVESLEADGSQSVQVFDERLIAQCGEPFRASPVSSGSVTGWGLGSAPEGVTLEGAGILWVPTRFQTGPQQVELIAQTTTGPRSHALLIDVQCEPVRYGVGCGCSQVPPDPQLLVYGLLSLAWFARRRRS